MTLLEWFGSGQDAHVRQFSIDHRVSTDSRSIWLALAVGQVDSREHISVAVDGHIALFRGDQILLPV